MNLPCDLRSLFFPNQFHLGSQASDILERGLNAEVPTKWENGILIFSPGPDSEMITLEKALALKDAIESELP